MEGVEQFKVHLNMKRLINALCHMKCSEQKLSLSFPLIHCLF